MIFKYKETAQYNILKSNGNVELLGKYAKHLQEVNREPTYSFDESSIILPSDKHTLRLVDETVSRYVHHKKLKYFIDVGIGGSNLGTKAVYDALFGYFDLVELDRYPKMYFADTNDPRFLYGLRSFLTKIKDPDEVVINIVSKSGATTETLANAEILLNKMPRFVNRVVVTTDYGSPLWIQAEEIGLTTLPIPVRVGGRFSVFSTVGLFPLASIGINIKQLVAGAESIRDKCLTSTIERNPAALSALVLYYHYTKKISIHDTFLFHPELESIGKWYRQLVGESLGKEGVGITPTISVGSTDLHSMGQLYVGGPRDKVFTFVSTQRDSSAIPVPAEAFFPDLTPETHGKSAGEIMNAIERGVQITFKKQKIPYMENILEDLSPFSLGEFLQFKMLEVMYLGKLFDVKTFNQPDVESYKAETKRILKES